MALGFRSAGESHGRGIFALVEGLPAGLELDRHLLDGELSRRRCGYGRGGRQRIEADAADILSGARHGITNGCPLLIAIWNRDSRLETAPELYAPRPGHADLAGHLKYGVPIRDVLERASARETAARVACGAVCRMLLRKFGIEIRSRVTRIGAAAAPAKAVPGWNDFEGADDNDVRCPDRRAAVAMRREIDRASARGDTAGGVFEVAARGVPAGLGSYAQWDRRLDARLAAAIMSIPAVKGVEIGAGFALAGMPGSLAVDPVGYSAPKHPSPDGGFFRRTNNMGGIEGGVSNGMPIIVRAAMKPIPTLLNPAPSVDIRTGRRAKASVERSDCCAVPAASVVGEAMVAFVLADAFLEKFGGDSMEEIERNYRGYIRAISRRRTGKH
ncbi:MAG: chorismate synthase [Planctomycetota bacterium]|nr:chorismate synthase [Planctomycetota bacterium]